ncbi:TraB/GumN family protein [Variovorax ginsengisoli]|uniref:Uncharacterized protein YbaP (TraB family) n=1 Tax=Variovorax ginsengisoli TaxID=363844 RepID=A0ABT9SA51_9BURK|nr:TraB/GumN family protein [Variovorax ginsengisoli]MDP9901236.1 uncharacterized protein YbaP (TraB family) [Variovorax ginsengisoli]
MTFPTAAPTACLASTALTGVGQVAIRLVCRMGRLGRTVARGGAAVLLAALLMGTGAAMAQVQAQPPDAEQPQDVPRASSCPPLAQPVVRTAAEAAQALAHAPDRGLLWRIERGGRVSWLYGTLHLGRADWVFPGPRTLQALQGSQTVALELDLRDPATLALLTTPPDAARVARLRTADRVRRLERQVAAACLPAGSFAGLGPVMQATTLVLLAARHEGLYGEFGTETLLSDVAHRDGKRVVALESAAAQLRALAGESEAADAAQIDASLTLLESGAAWKQAADMADAWARSDWTHLSHYADWCECMDTPTDRRAMRRLLDDRNPGLADGIARLHARGQQVFAAVGALHMVGPHGLPALMAARGFKVMPVVPAAH